MSCTPIQSVSAGLFVDNEDVDFGCDDASADVTLNVDAEPSPNPRPVIDEPHRRELARQSAVALGEVRAPTVIIDADDEPPPSDFLTQWRGHRKHYFIFTQTGRPVFSYHCSDQPITELFGFMYAFLSFAQRANDQLVSITAGPQVFAFSQLGNLWYVATSRCNETVYTLQRQMHTLHQLVLTTLTGSICRQVARNARLDLEHLLGDSARILRECVRAHTSHPAVSLTAAECVPLPRPVRDALGASLAAAQSPSSVFAFVLAGRRLVQLVRRRDAPMHPLDLLLTTMVIVNAVSAQASGDTWLPICLPAYEPGAYVFAYVHFFGGVDGKALALCIVSRDQAEFPVLLDKREAVMQTMRNTLVPMAALPELGPFHPPIADYVDDVLRGTTPTPGQSGGNGAAAPQARHGDEGAARDAASSEPRAAAGDVAVAGVTPAGVAAGTTDAAAAGAASSDDDRAAAPAAADASAPTPTEEASGGDPGQADPPVAEPTRGRGVTASAIRDSHFTPSPPPPVNRAASYESATKSPPPVPASDAPDAAAGATRVSESASGDGSGARDSPSRTAAPAARQTPSPPRASPTRADPAPAADAPQGPAISPRHTAPPLRPPASPRAATGVQLAALRGTLAPPGAPGRGPSGVPMEVYLAAAARYTYPMPDIGIPEVKHFVLKQLCLCTMPIFPAPYDTPAGRRRLVRLYSRFRCIAREMGMGAGEERSLYAMRDTEAFYVLQTPGVELVICLSVLATRATAVAAAAAVRQWVAQSEADLFVGGACW